MSPINGQNRGLVAALDDELVAAGHSLPVYWGNRNWHPYLADAVRQMRDDGVERALAFVTSGYSSYSSCRQYLEDIEAAREQVGPGAPVIDKLRQFYDHPGYVGSVRSIARGGLGRADADAARRRPRRVHRAQPSDRDGREIRLRRAAAVRPPDSSPSAVRRGSRGRSCTRAAAARRRSPGSTPDIGDHIETLAAAARARGRRRADRLRLRPHGGHLRPRCRRGEAGRSGGHRASSRAVDSGYRPRVRVDGARAHRGASRSVAAAPSAGFAGRAPGRVPGLLRVTAIERRRALRAPRPRRGRGAGARCPPQTAGARRAPCTLTREVRLGIPDVDRCDGRGRGPHHVEAPGRVSPNRATCGWRRRSTRSTSHEPRGFELSVHHRYDAMVTCPSSKLRRRASRSRSVFLDGPSKSLTERVEVGESLVADLALEPAGRASSIRAERRNRRDHPPAAHTAKFGERMRHALRRHVFECLERRDDVERAAREREPLREVRPPDEGRDRARGACAIAQRLVSMPSASMSSSRSASTTKPCAHPASRTRPGGKKRHSRYATTSAFDVSRVYRS